MTEAGSNIILGDRSSGRTDGSRRSRRWIMDANQVLSGWSGDGAAASVLTLASAVVAESKRAAAASQRYHILTRRGNARSVSARKVFEEFFADHVRR
jgi:hypothetical protein